MVIFEFREIQQESSETLNEFYRRLETKAVNCGFDKEDDEIKTQVMTKPGIQDSERRPREKAWLDLATRLDSLDRTDEQAKRLERRTASINLVHNHRKAQRLKNLTAHSLVIPLDSHPKEDW